jgi:hypothetical protein
MIKVWGSVGLPLRVGVRNECPMGLPWDIAAGLPWDSRGTSRTTHSDQHRHPNNTP